MVGRVVEEGREQRVRRVLQLAALDDDPRLRKLVVVANVVDMDVRVDDEPDVAGLEPVAREVGLQRLLRRLVKGGKMFAMPVSTMTGVSPPRIR